MGLFSKGKKAYSIFSFKCPRCHEGHLFNTQILEFKGSFDMAERCSVCQQNYMPEPGFYFGAMFISYIIMGWFCLGFVGFCMLVLEMSVNTSFVWLIIICAIMFVWIFRISRSIWINMNIKYDPDILRNKNLS